MMTMTTQAPTAGLYASEGSKKRRRTNDAAASQQIAASSSGQLSLFDVWGNGGNLTQGRGGRPGVKCKKNKNRKSKTINNHERHNSNMWNPNHFNNDYRHDQQLISGRTEAVCSSSIASRTDSSISLFSLYTPSASSDLTDQFDDLDLEFDPKLFVLEVDVEHGLHPSWLEQLKPILMQPETISLHQQLGPSHLGYDYKAGQQPVSLLTQVLPRPTQLYNWSRLTPLQKVKVVILGSRPSQCLGHSHGLAFSQPVGCTRLSGAIESIHRELSIEYPNRFVKPDHGSLVSWAKSGVLLLNEVQTIQRDHPSDHSKFGWFDFTAKILEVVSRFGGSQYSSDTTTDAILEDLPESCPVSRKGVVFIAWGERALELIKSAGIYLSDRNHHVLCSKGSPYANSAHEDGFFNNQHFVSCNEFLSSTYGPEAQIDWCNLEAVDPPA